MSQGEDRPRRGSTLASGTWIRGKYRLDSVLGQGGMATVYAATHRNKKRFAVKMLHPELSRHEELRARFLREGYVANSVEHPGAVAVLDDDVSEDGAAFLVMELLDGTTVEHLHDAADRRLPARVALCIADQLLDVLAAAHARNVVHRDIKPANLFVTREGQVKVLDFGIARLREAGNSSGTTSTGMTLGTPAYMSPEQARGKTSQIDARTDVWAVGATIFALASGHDVREGGESAQEMMVVAATTPAPALASVWAEAPPGVAALVDRALAFAVEDRWASAAEMRDAIRTEYRALFGEPISPAPLAALLATTHVIRASQVELVLNPSEAISQPTLEAPSSPGRRASAVTGRRGSTTAEPVSSDGAGGRPSRTWVRAAVAGAGAVLAAGIVAVWLTSGKTPAKADGPPSPGQPASAPAKVVMLAPPSSAPEQSAASTVLPATGTSAPTASASASVAASTRPAPKQTRTGGGATSTAAAPASSARPAPTSHDAFDRQ